MQDERADISSIPAFRDVKIHLIFVERPFSGVYFWIPHRNLSHCLSFETTRN